MLGTVKFLKLSFWLWQYCLIKWVSENPWNTEHMDFNATTFITSGYSLLLKQNCQRTTAHVKAFNLSVITICINLKISCCIGTCTVSSMSEKILIKWFSCTFSFLICLRFISSTPLICPCSLCRVNLVCLDCPDTREDKVLRWFSIDELLWSVNVSPGSFIRALTSKMCVFDWTVSCLIKNKGW